jgi:hypothetical protein
VSAKDSKYDTAKVFESRMQLQILSDRAVFLDVCMAQRQVPP